MATSSNHQTLSLDTIQYVSQTGHLACIPLAEVPPSNVNNWAPFRSGTAFNPPATSMYSTLPALSKATPSLSAAQGLKVQEIRPDKTHDLFSPN